MTFHSHAKKKPQSYEDHILYRMRVGILAPADPTVAAKPKKKVSKLAKAWHQKRRGPVQSLAW
jgi:hypothetical protein